MGSTDSIAPREDMQCLNSVANVFEFELVCLERKLCLYYLFYKHFRLHSPSDYQINRSLGGGRCISVPVQRTTEREGSWAGCHSSADIPSHRQQRIILREYHPEPCTQTNLGHSATCPQPCLPAGPRFRSEFHI